MAYSPKSIANFFLDLAKSSGETISSMKLQKLVYYANGWYAGHTGESLIDEAIEAWQYGPVIPSLYHAFKGFGSGPITSPATDFNTSSFAFDVVSTPTEEPIRSFLTNVWNSYGGFTALKLSEMTHAPDSPWDQTWKQCGGTKGAAIPPQLIVDHFRAAVEKSKPQSAT